MNRLATIALLLAALTACTVRVQPNIGLRVQAVATTSASCKDGGWRSLHRADGSRFKNQGACVRYAERGR